MLTLQKWITGVLWWSFLSVILSGCLVTLFAFYLFIYMAFAGIRYDESTDSWTKHGVPMYSEKQEGWK